MIQPHHTFGASSHDCVPERVYIVDPTGRRLTPRGFGAKIAVNFLEGEPVSASIRLDSGDFTIVGLGWIAEAPRATVIPGPWTRRAAGSDWTRQEVE